MKFTARESSRIEVQVTIKSSAIVSILLLAIPLGSTAFSQWQAFGDICLAPSESTFVGRGFVSPRSKSICTCSHVVKAGTSFWFRYPSSEGLVEIRLKHNLPECDLALLERVEGVQPIGLPFGDFGTVQLGDTIRYPGVDTTSKTLTYFYSVVIAKGSLWYPPGVKVDFLEFPGEVSPGYSGSPVLDASGDVVAIISEGWSCTAINRDPSRVYAYAFSIEKLRVLDSQLGKPSRSLMRNRD
jgi:S1-C subfamily serine protease